MDEQAFAAAGPLTDPRCDPGDADSRDPLIVTWIPVIRHQDLLATTRPAIEHQLTLDDPFRPATHELPVLPANSTRVVEAPTGLHADPLWLAEGKEPDDAPNSR